MERRGPRPSELLSELEQWDLRSVSSGSRSSVHSHDGTPHISRAASSTTLTEHEAEGRRASGSARPQQIAGRISSHQQTAGASQLANGSLVAATSSSSADVADGAGAGAALGASGVSRSASLQQIRASFFTSAPSLPPSISILHDQQDVVVPTDTASPHRRSTRPASTSPERALFGERASYPSSLHDA